MNIEQQVFEDYPMYVLFTCDLELDPPWNIRSWNKRTTLGIERGLPILLEVLKKYNIQATFFTEGGLAKNQSMLIKELQKTGHEIGCHGYAHESYGGTFRLDPFIPSPRVLSPQDRERAILLAKDGLEEIINAQVNAFRAPFLHIDSKTIAILNEKGFLVDSSLFNNVFGRLSNPYHPLQNNLMKEEGDGVHGTQCLLEIPVTVDPIPCFLPHTPYEQINNKEVKDSIKAVKAITLLSKIKKIPVVIVLISHSWEFLDMKNPLGTVTGNKRKEMLDGFLGFLSSLNKSCFVTFAQMRCIWENEYCPIHAKS